MLGQWWGGRLAGEPWQQSAIKPHTTQEGIHFVALSRVGVDRVAILEAPIVPLSAFPGDAHLHTWSAGKAIGPGILVATQGKQPAFVTSLGPAGFLIGGLPLPGAPVAFARVDCAGDVTPVIPKTGCITGQVAVAAGLPFGEAALVAVASDRAVGACDDVGPLWMPRVHLLLQGASGPAIVGDELSATEMPTRLRLLPRPGGAWLVVTDASGMGARRVNAKGKLLGEPLDLGNVKDVASMGERLVLVNNSSLRVVGDGFASDPVALTTPKGDIVRAWLAVSPAYDTLGRVAGSGWSHEGLRGDRPAHKQGAGRDGGVRFLVLPGRAERGALLLQRRAVTSQRARVTKALMPASG